MVMKNIIFFILLSIIFCGCSTEHEATCAANGNVSLDALKYNFAPPLEKNSRAESPSDRSIVSISMGNNFAAPFRNRGKGTECPANYKRPLKSLAETNCPANVTERETVKTEAHSNCPPAALGAEKLLGYIDEMEKISDKHATFKTDPVSGKKTTQAKGIRTGELEKPVKPTKEQVAYYKKKKAEEKAIIKQIKRDLIAYNKEEPPF